MATHSEKRAKQVRTLSPDEARKAFDAEARLYLGMSGEEFIAKWDAGEFQDPDQPNIIHVALLLPLVR